MIERTCDLVPRYVIPDEDIWSMSLECHPKEHQHSCSNGNRLEKGNDDVQKKRTNEPSQERFPVCVKWMVNTCLLCDYDYCCCSMKVSS